MADFPDYAAHAGPLLSTIDWTAKVPNPATTRFRGHLRGRQYQRDALLRLLFDEYGNYSPFVEDFDYAGSCLEQLGLDASPWPPQHDRTLGIHVVESLAERWNLVRAPDFCEGHYRHLRMALAIKSLTEVDDDTVTFGSAIATGGFVSDRPSVSYDGRSWW